MPCGIFTKLENCQKYVLCYCLLLHSTLSILVLRDSKVLHELAHVMGAFQMVKLTALLGFL